MLDISSSSSLVVAIIVLESFVFVRTRLSSEIAFRYGPDVWSEALSVVYACLPLLRDPSDPSSDEMLKFAPILLSAGRMVVPQAAMIPTWTSTRFQMDSPVRVTNDKSLDWKTEADTWIHWARLYGGLDSQIASS